MKKRKNFKRNGKKKERKDKRKGSMKIKHMKNVKKENEKWTEGGQKENAK